MEEAATSPTAVVRGCWSSLPADLLRDILARLPWSSHPSFAATCAHWRSAVAPFYPAWITPVLLSAADVGSTNLRFYSPYYHKNFQLDETLESPNARICCANGRHLILYQSVADKNVVVDANLVTGDIYDFYLPESTRFHFVAVYDGGAGKQQVMFGVHAHVLLQAARSLRPPNGQGWSAWEFSELDPEGPELAVSPRTNPVLHHGLLYLLGVDGKLAVHDDSRHSEGFQLLDMPAGFGFQCDDDESHLFESDEGELMAVLIGRRRGSPVQVVRLNERSMEWEKVESLKGRALFTGTLTTVMVKTGVKWMQDKIFVPRLHEWPETIHADLVDREGELAFVPKSTAAAQGRAACGKGIWTCALPPQESSVFWETINVDYSIWVDLRN